MEIDSNPAGAPLLRHPKRLPAAAVVAVLASLVLVAPVPLRAAADDHGSEPLSIGVLPLHISVFGRPGLIVREIVDGALRRVQRPRCESLIGELNDSDGKPLAWNLSERGMSPVQYMAELRFYEGDGLRQCQIETTVAVTAPNSRVVFVCARRFAHHFALRRTRGEVIIIHEFLHSLGLGENPPSSGAITELVERRCGD